MLFLYNIKILRTLRFKSSYVFLKRPPGPLLTRRYDVLPPGGKTHYRQVASSLEVPRVDVMVIISIWDLTGISAALLPTGL